MEWIDAMNRAIDYIESNLAGTVDINEAAHIACASPFHFQRTFSIIAGVTIGEYIRIRRLTLSAQDILAGHKIIDVSMKYGYDSPEAFSRAFKKVHGIAPSHSRKESVTLKSYPRMRFHISITGGTTLEYRIIQKGPLTLAGKTIRVSNANGENFKRIPIFWDECEADGSLKTLFRYKKQLGVLGVCFDFDMENRMLSYMIGVEDSPEVPAQFIRTELPASQWAVFEATGPMPGSIQSLWPRIYAEWFPESQYEHTGSAELEVYAPGDPSASDYHSEIWIPVREKRRK